VGKLMQNVILVIIIIILCFGIALFAKKRSKVHYELINITATY